MANKLLNLEKIEKASESFLDTLFGQQTQAKRRSATADLLILLLVSGGVFISLSTAPSLLVAAVPFVQVFKYKDKSKVQHALYYTKRAHLVAVQKRDRHLTFSLTQKGRERARMYWLKELSINQKKQKKWSGTWYLVVFDIAYTKKNVRDALRLLIKRLGCVQLQKSV